MTVATWVCWSMISETQTEYGDRLFRQGRDRACRLNQARSARRIFAAWGLVSRLSKEDPARCLLPNSFLPRIPLAYFKSKSTLCEGETRWLESRACASSRYSPEGIWPTGTKVAMGMTG